MDEFAINFLQTFCIQYDHEISEFEVGFPYYTFFKKKALLMDRETLFDLGLLQNFIGVRIIQIFAQYVLYYTCFYFESL